MKSIVLAIALFFVSLPSFAQQGKYGFEAGVGYTTFSKSYITPSLQGYWLGRLSHTFYLGGAISFQRYSMLYTDKVSPAMFGDILDLRQKSGYVFFTPKIEMGIGRTKHLFVNFACGPGIYAGGNQWIHQYEPSFIINPGGIAAPDTTFTNTSQNVPNFAFRFTGGFKQRYTTYSYWNIVVSEEFTYLPGKLNKVGPDMKTNYFAITIGVMHKYPSVAMEED